MRIYTLILVIVTWTNLIFSQNEKVELTSNALTFDVGEPITITVKSNVQGMVDIDYPSVFVHGYDMVSGMEQDMDANTGQITTIYYLSQTGAIAKAGKYTLGPAYIKKGNKSFISNTITVTIGKKIKMNSGKVTAQQLKDPAFGLIQTNKNTIYEGEPLITVAKVYATYEPTHIDGYHEYNIGTLIDKHPLNKNNRNTVKKEQFKGRMFFAFEYDKNVLFPTGTGTFSISPYKMSVNQDFQGYTLLSSTKDITVLPLPSGAPSDFISGVGEFDIQRTIEDSLIEQGNVFSMKVTINGTGNLHNVTEPKLNFPSGFVIYGDPTIEENYQFCSLGAQGLITYKYNIQVNKHGEIIIPPNSISYFDVKKEKYVTVHTSSDTLKVKKDAKFLNPVDHEAKNSVEKIHLYPDLLQDDKRVSRTTFFNTPVYWIALSSPFALALIFIFFRKKKEEDNAVSDDKLSLQSMSSNTKELDALAQKGETINFYNLAENTLLNHISKHFRVDFGKSRGQALERLAESNTALSQEIKTVLEKADLCKYGMGDNSSFNILKDEFYSLLEKVKTL